MTTDKIVSVASLDTYRQFANNSDTEFAVLLKESIRSLEYFQESLKEAFENADYSRMKALSHSIASELFYLKANNLKALLKNLIATELNATTNMENLLQVIMEIEDVLQFLKQNLQSIAR